MARPPSLRVTRQPTPLRKHPSPAISRSSFLDAVSGQRKLSVRHVVDLGYSTQAGQTLQCKVVPSQWTAASDYLGGIKIM